LNRDAFEDDDKNGTNPHQDYQDTGTMDEIPKRRIRKDSKVGHDDGAFRESDGCRVGKIAAGETLSDPHRFMEEDRNVQRRGESP
jgi:hypothetical protein